MSGYGGSNQSSNVLKVAGATAALLRTAGIPMTRVEEEGVGVQSARGVGGDRNDFSPSPLSFTTVVCSATNDGNSRRITIGLQ